MNVKLLVISSIIVLLIIGYGLFFIHIPGKKDVIETHKIYDFIWNHLANDSNIKLYVSPRNNKNFVDIYGLRDEQKQEDLIAKLKFQKQSVKWKPLVITFFQNENWIQNGKQRIRDKEVVLRTEIIK